MSRFDAIDLTQLPKPEVIKELDFEAALAEVKAKYLQLYPDFSADLESEPVVKLLEVAAYFRMTGIAKINDAARSVMLAFATGGDLDHIGARYGVERQVVDPGDPTAIPPVDPTLEDDPSYKRRVQLSPEAFTVAGSLGSYVFNALSAGDEPFSIDVSSPEPGAIHIKYEMVHGAVATEIKDASAYRSDPGEVTVTVMGWEGSGIPSQEALDAIETHLTDLYVRPLGDTVIVRAVEIIDYTINATLQMQDGPASPLVQEAATAALQEYVDSRHRIGRRITDSGLMEAATVAGVEKVDLNGFTDIEPTQYQAARCTNITVTVEAIID